MAEQLITACKICGEESLPYVQKNGAGQTWNINECSSCGFGFVTNRPSLEFLAKYYSELIEPPTSQRARADRYDCKILTGWIARATEQRGWSLDVGGGDGGFSYYLHGHGFKPVIIDFSDASKDLSADIPGREFHNGSFEDFHSERQFSAILMSQALEHSLEPLDWIRKAADLLAPGGTLTVAVPNFRGVYRMLGARDPFLFPPQHLNFFTKRALETLFRRCAIEPVMVRSQSWINTRPTGLARSAVFKVWNAVSKALDPTPYGIILTTIGRRN